MVAHEWLHMNRSAFAGFHAQPANPHAQPACATRMRSPGKSGPAGEDHGPIHKQSKTSNEQAIWRTLVHHISS
eukprot:11180249-Lingulodinium_polyedra.AAC.1